MNHLFNPFGIFALALQQQGLLISSIQTIWLRTSLMMMGTMTPVEATAMCVEKPAAFAKAMNQGARAVRRGRSPAQVMSATLKPISAKAASNARRLSR